MGQTWQSQLGSPGSVAESVLGRLFESREFWLLVPDANNKVLTAGKQSGTTLAVAAKTSDNHTVIAYIPTQRAITITLTNISGTNVTAWWFNPQTAATTLSGTFATTGSRSFTPPDTNDWVLVLDDASQNYSAPGIGKLAGINNLTIKSLSDGRLLLTVLGAPYQGCTLMYTTSLGLPWQPLVTGTTDGSGTFLFTNNAVLPASYYRSSFP